VVLFDDGGEILPSGRAVSPPLRRGGHSALEAQPVRALAGQVTCADRPRAPEIGTDGGQVALAQLAMSLFELLALPMKPPPDRCPACAGETRLVGIGYRVCVAACATQVRPKRW